MVESLYYYAVVMFKLTEVKVMKVESMRYEGWWLVREVMEFDVTAIGTATAKIATTTTTTTSSPLHIIRITLVQY
jgi:hypothetical protein